MSTESMMPSNYFVLCHLLLLLPSIFPSITFILNHALNALCNTRLGCVCSPISRSDPGLVLVTAQPLYCVPAFPPAPISSSPGSLLPTCTVMSSISIPLPVETTTELKDTCAFFPGLREGTPRCPVHRVGEPYITTSPWLQNFQIRLRSTQQRLGGEWLLLRERGWAMREK